MYSSNNNKKENSRVRKIGDLGNFWPNKAAKWKEIPEDGHEVDSGNRTWNHETLNRVFLRSKWFLNNECLIGGSESSCWKAY